MTWDIAFQDDTLDAAQDSLQSDPELWSLAQSSGIDFAGGLLNRRAHPDVEGFSSFAYWEKLKTEFVELVCTRSAKYKKVRDDADAVMKSGQWIVPIIAGAFAAQLHLTAGLLVPFISLLLLAGTQLTITA